TTPADGSQPDLITHVAVHKMTHHDSQALTPAIANVRARQWCPAQWLGDSHYGSTESIEQCQREGIALVAPARPPKGVKQGQLTLEDFPLDEGGCIMACLQGHAPVWPSVRETQLAVRFEARSCQGGSYTDRCPGYSAPQAKSDVRWQYTHERVAQRT